MRVNVYAEEMTDRVELIRKTIDGNEFTAVRFYLELPCTIGKNGDTVRGPFIHRPGDDDSSAVTFWGKKDLRKMLQHAIDLLDEHYARAGKSMTGCQLIAEERLRQVTTEGWTLEHDDAHCCGSLAMAAACYAAPVPIRAEMEVPCGCREAICPHSAFGKSEWRDPWPWGPEWDKRNKHDRIKALAIAGALIAAEIDRLQRAKRGAA